MLSSYASNYKTGALNGHSDTDLSIYSSGSLTEVIIAITARITGAT